MAALHNADLVVVFDDYSSFSGSSTYYALLERDGMNGIGKIKRDELFTVYRRLMTGGETETMKWIAGVFFFCLFVFN